MNWKKYLALWGMVALLLIPFTNITHANSAEPPSFTIIITQPPEDLVISLQLGGNEIKSVELRKDQKAWEAYYRFFYGMSPIEKYKMDGASLVVSTKEDQWEMELPIETFDTYNNVLTLDIENQTLTMGTVAWRTPLLVGLRVISTLLLEAIVFFLVGYRKRNSWLVFLGVNLITQGGLNLMITGPMVGSYWMYGYILGEIVIVVVESNAYARLLKEQSRRRAILCAILANLVSLVLGGLLLAYLPI